MMKIQVLEKVKAFPFDGYRKVTSYNDVNFISAEQHNGIEYFRLHLENGCTATYDTVDYIIEFI